VGGALAALATRSSREGWCTSGELGRLGPLSEILIGAFIVFVALGFVVAALIVGLRGGPAFPLLALGLGIVAGLAATAFVPHPDCSDPNLVPSSGTIVIELDSGWDRRLSGSASCTRDRQTGAVLTVTQDDAVRYGAWQTDGWTVLVSIDDYRASVGEPTAVLQLTQSATNPYQMAYWLRDQATAQATNDSDGLGGTITFRDLVSDTDLTELPFDPERQTRPFPVPKMLDVTITWDCRGD